MSGGFKRSGVFGIAGVFVVAALVAAIGLTMGQGDADPKLALGLIFGLLAVFMVVLFALQRSDLGRAAAGSRSGTERAAAAGGGRQVDDPTTLSEPELWAAMAVRPIGDEAVRARAEAWEPARRSQSLGMIVTLLIFLTVPPIYLLESFVPLLIGGPLIVIAALYGSFRAVAPGGDLDQGYERVGLAMAPLGLAVSERPSVGIELRDPVQGRLGPKVRGALELSGERHGRPVKVRLGSGEVSRESEVTVAAPCAPFVAKARGGRVQVESGPAGIVIARRGGDQADWLCDLWLAERLASA